MGHLPMPSPTPLVPVPGCGLPVAPAFWLPSGDRLQGPLGSHCLHHRKAMQAPQKGAGGWGPQLGARGSGALLGGDLDKDTLAFGAKERWETWQDRGINRDANKQGGEAPGERGRGMSGSQGGL